MHIAKTTSRISNVSRVTKRERQILNLLSEGYSSKEIGSRLYISPFTVETHKRNLMTKFNARNIVHLAVTAERHGINKSGL